MIEIFDLDSHNSACERIAELRRLDPTGTNPEVIKEATELADEILNFWKHIAVDGDPHE